MILLMIKLVTNNRNFIFSSPERSPGRAIILPPASALASALMLALVAVLAAAVLAKSLTKFFM